jgi:hypothetical protein
MQRLASVLVATALAACVLAAPDQSLTRDAGAGACPSGKKSCDGACVAVDDPRFGCGVESCAPCAMAGSDAVCRGGACTPTRPLGQWLAAHTGGLCLERYHQFVSYCLDPDACANHADPGDECFCFDPFWMRPYPDGIALDIGLYWDGRGGGSPFQAGGDCDGKRLAFDVRSDGALVFGGPMTTRLLAGTLTPGRHLLSAYMRADRYVLYVDGVEADRITGPGVAPELAGKCGPGVMTGARISYWWEQSAVSGWFRSGLFFVHVRDAATPERFDLREATERGPHTMVRYEGKPEGRTWVDGSHVAYVAGDAAWADPIEGCLQVGSP